MTMVANNQETLKTEQKLISHNLALHATFYPKYYLLEVTLKNRLFATIKRQLGEDWFSQQIAAEDKDSLFTEEILHILRRKPQNFELRDHGLLVESGLGFWVEFFNKRLYKLTKGHPLSIFTSLPKGIKRKDVYKKLDLVKDFRNRLFHYRIPIVKDHSQLNYLDELVKIDNELISLLTWMDVYTMSDNLNLVLEKEVQQIKQLIETESSAR